ncbi:MAG: 6-phosphogluconolactonase [Bacteroidota bacterium]
MNVREIKSRDELDSVAADLIVDILGRAINDKGIAHLAVSGGSTPNGLFQLLANGYQNELHWEKVMIWWVDERWVPVDHDENNYAQANKAGLGSLGAKLFPMDTSFSNAQETGDNYIGLLKQYFEGDTPPALDLILLGAGTDGHTASLFEEHIELLDDSRWVVVTRNPHNLQTRISLNFNVLIKAHHQILLIPGQNKKETLERIKNRTEPFLPIQIVMSKANNPVILTDI